MTDEPGSQVEQRPKRKLKKKVAQKTETPFDIAETFEVSDAKDKDFDLDFKGSLYQAKKGQAGTRSKMVGGGDPLDRVVDPRSD